MDSQQITLTRRDRERWIWNEIILPAGVCMLLEEKLRNCKKYIINLRIEMENKYCLAGEDKEELDHTQA